MKGRRQRQAKNIRTHRKVHRTSGAFLFIFFFFIAITGIILGWKKHSGNMINPKTHQGTSTNFDEWLPLEELNLFANAIIKDSIATNQSFHLDRIDIRKEKGVAKFTYKDHFWEIQLDAATGKLLHIGKRNGDLFENIHDGSILDKYFQTSNGQIKLIYSTITGFALLLFTVTGFWLWYGPKRMKKAIKKG